MPHFRQKNQLRPGNRINGGNPSAGGDHQILIPVNDQGAAPYLPQFLASTTKAPPPGTHQYLRTATDDGDFRSVLYYRLNILRLRTTPLRERPEDIALICWSISQRLLVQGQPPGGADIPTALLPHLSRYAWPGNFRELEKVIERAMLSARELLHDHGLDEHYLARLPPDLISLAGNQKSVRMPSGHYRTERTYATEAKRKRRRIDRPICLDVRCCPYGADPQIRVDYARDYACHRRVGLGCQTFDAKKAIHP
ncbi:hypothetical protein [Pseudomonas ekonensis]|uniref:hypothetical protein n=1 Tax=Pseudomonas ekonensis TaxID=2842353 RepID=UPI001CED90F4|nr:hypothetical protein [Pseudomonas ekonensis]